jgi:hypothetical protein
MPSHLENEGQSSVVGCHRGLWCRRAVAVPQMAPILSSLGMLVKGDATGPSPPAAIAASYDFALSPAYESPEPPWRRSEQR